MNPKLNPDYKELHLSTQGNDLTEAMRNAIVANTSEKEAAERKNSTILALLEASTILKEKSTYARTLDACLQFEYFSLKLNDSKAPRCNLLIEAMESQVDIDVIKQMLVYIKKCYKEVEADIIFMAAINSLISSEILEEDKKLALLEAILQHEVDLNFPAVEMSPCRDPRQSNQRLMGLPLMTAIMIKSEKIIQFLLRRGAHVNLTDPTANATCLQRANSSVFPSAYTKAVQSASNFYQAVELEKEGNVVKATIAFLTACDLNVNTVLNLLEACIFQANQQVQLDVKSEDNYSFIISLLQYFNNTYNRIFNLADKAKDEQAVTARQNIEAYQRFKNVLGFLWANECGKVNSLFISDEARREFLTQPYITPSLITGTSYEETFLKMQSSASSASTNSEASSSMAANLLSFVKSEGKGKEPTREPGEKPAADSIQSLTN